MAPACTRGERIETDAGTREAVFALPESALQGPKVDADPRLDQSGDTNALGAAIGLAMGDAGLEQEPPPTGKKY